MKSFKCSPELAINVAILISLLLCSAVVGVCIWDLVEDEVHVIESERAPHEYAKRINCPAAEKIVPGIMDMGEDELRSVAGVTSVVVQICQEQLLYLKHSTWALLRHRLREKLTWALIWENAGGALLAACLGVGLWFLVMLVQWARAVMLLFWPTAVVQGKRMSDSQFGMNMEFQKSV
jgi:hypothetical protein